MEAIRQGITRLTVTEAHTARAVGSGTLEVLATPVLASLLERAAWQAVQEELEEGRTTVGVSLELRHNAPTPIGGKVTAVAVLTAIEGRKMTFALSASDDAGEVAEGTHVRVIVEGSRLEQKAAARRS
ncbi:MAG: thioesterase family protein [Christensenellales bacterium]|jgi:fluoroacetyl-CoA thioesterase